MSKFLRLSAALPLCVTLLGAAHAQTEKPALTVYTYSGFTSEYGPGGTIKERFEATCGCTLEWVTSEDAGTLLARLKLEGASTRADVVRGLDTNLTAQAEATGLIEAGGRVAVLRMSEALLEATGATMDDTEGLINMPLTAQHVQAVILFKTDDGGRVSLRSKGTIDVRGVAVKYGGGGHKNAAGLTLEDATADAERALIREVVAAVESAGA